MAYVAKLVLMRATLGCGVALAALPVAAPGLSQVTEPVRDPAAPGTEVQTTEEAETSLDASKPVGSETTATEDRSDIVVTGTLVRGIAPPGANVIGISQADVQATGATTTAQLLQTIPQLGGFNGLLAPVNAGNNVTVNRPNLRNIPSFNTAGGSTTLVLMDGHRLVGMGVQSTTPDPDVIPPGALQRVEVVPDGGSAVYGSDAVAGVLNFITLKRFDGLKVDGQYGFADKYHQATGNVTAGKDWGSGSAYISYNYSERGKLFGRDRDFVRFFPDPANGRLSIQCNPGVVQATVGGVSRFYDLPFTTATATARAVPLNQCDTSNDATFYPSERRHTALVSLSQEVNDLVTVDVRAFYTNRETRFSAGPYRQSQTVSRATILSRFPTQIIGNEASQSVSFLFGGVDAARQKINLETYGVTPTITADLGGGWQLRALGTYSHSDTLSRQNSFNATALTNAVNLGLFNPYNPAVNDPAAVGIVTNFQTYGRAKQRLIDGRLVIDGELFKLPGGGVKLAAGVEYDREDYGVRSGSVVPGNARTGFGAQLIGASTIAPAVLPLPLFDLDRNVKSVFGELVVPLFGADNATTLFRELTFSAAGRYDDYNDVGSTFNPRLGLTWRPAEWIKLRGAWGKSFNAPSLADAGAAAPTSVFLTGGLPPANTLVTNGGVFPVPVAGVQTNTLAIRGNFPGIEPQKAETYTLGLDVEPPFIAGLNFSVSYYNIKLRNLIGLPPGAVNSDQFYQQVPFLVTVIPSGQAGADLVAATIASATPGSFTNLGGCAALPTCVYSIRDLRKRNLGRFNTDGLDFNGAYHTDTSFGSVNLGANATYVLNSRQQPIPGAVFNNTRLNASRFRLRATAGFETGGFLGQVTLNHNAGFRIVNIATFVGTDFAGTQFVQQGKVGDFNTVDLFFKYTIGGEGFTKDLDLTLNINNLINQDPPEYRALQTGAAGQGVTNGLTVGRLVQFGISKKF